MSVINGSSTGARSAEQWYLTTLVASVGVVAATAGVIPFSAPVASAAAPTNLITVSTWFSVTDDDSTIFGPSYTYAYGYGPTRYVTVGTDKSTGSLVNEAYIPPPRVRRLGVGKVAAGGAVTSTANHLAM